ncbi:SLC13 family permease [Sporosarcina cyprini]|uniref:SLC13 family permease n=1 Tax=Sporosarcina cyprini TaxID=2910523 RepID=UPI001EE04CB9|nr:SLC13 family permease [Sporosarcina cyprini]MCG3086567.1 anion permease [Sporosarcina cyprini]
MKSRKTLLFFSCLLAYVFTFLPVFQVPLVIKAFMCLIIIQALWIGGVFPLAFSSVLLMLMLSFHFFSYEETLSFFASEIVWLLFSTFIIAGAFIESGLASRLSLKLLALSRGSSRLLIFFSFILMFVLSLFIPSNVGKASLVASVLDEIVENLRAMCKVENVAKSLFIGLTFMVPISGAFVATGASSTIYAYGLLGGLTGGLDYVKWLVFMGPPILLFILLLYVLFIFIFPPEPIDKQLLKGLMDDRIEKLGKMSVPEIKVLWIIVLVVLLWMTESIHGYSVSLVALLGAALTMLPYSGVWKWEQASKKIGWDLILFFAATLMLSNMLIATGAVNAFANMLVTLFATDSYVWIVLLLLAVTALLRLVFVNVLGFLTIILPIAVTVGQAFPDQNPLFLAMGVFLMGIPGFLLVTQSPIHLISYEYGHFSKKDLLKIGSLSMGTWFAILIATMYGYWSIFY